MLFTDIRFVILVAGAWLSFAAAPASRRGAVLAVWGAVFYLLYAPSSAPVILGVVLATYVVPPRHWKPLVALTVAVLAYFKLGAREAVLPGQAGETAPSAALMPLGLSFLAFEMIHVAIERGRGRLGTVRFADFMGYALYFPCRVAGPIRRYPQFTTSMAAARPSVESLYAGLLRVLVGVAKKVAVADVLGLTVAEIAYASTPLHVTKVVLAYGLQIYLDFSAYSDIAIGVSRMFGITVPENFNHPYFSSTIQEFWTRWHISLSTWVRDYVFLPLGRAAFATPLAKRPALVAVSSYLVSFVVIGAWHGVTVNFVLWGAYHGLLLGAYYVYRRKLAVRLTGRLQRFQWPARVMATSATFILVMFGWILFMTPDPAAAARLLRTMMGRA